MNIMTREMFKKKTKKYSYIKIIWMGVRRHPKNKNTFFFSLLVKDILVSTGEWVGDCPKKTYLLCIVKSHLFNDVLALRIVLNNTLEVSLLNVVKQLVGLLRQFVRKWFLLPILLLASIFIILLASRLFVFW